MAEPADGCQAKKLVPRGLEPRTLRLLGVRSNQLSYETFCQSQQSLVSAGPQHALACVGPHVGLQEMCVCDWFV